MNGMFRSLRIFNYRVWFIGALVSNIGAWMQATALQWVVLTDLTNNDATAMGITMALQFAPPLLLVGVTGYVADHFDRRRLLILTQTLLLTLGATMGALLLSGLLTLPMMYGFAIVIGVVQAFDNPARQAFVSDLVSRESASNAVALNATSFNMARMVGPAVAGLLVVAIGSGWVFLVNAVTFIAMIIALSVIRTDELEPRVKAPGSDRLADGFRYVARRPDFIVTFIMVFLLGAFGMNFPIFASTMAKTFDREADGFGLLSSVVAIGSLAGALMAARRTQAQLRVVIAGLLLFAVAQGVSAFMPSFWTYAVLLVFVGFSTVTVMTTANGYVQTTSDPALRGRVMALYVAVIMGGTPIGAPIVGWVANTWGPRTAILVGAVAGLIAFLVGGIWVLRSGRIHRAADRRFALTLDATRPIDVVDLEEERVTPEAFSDEVASTMPIRLPHIDEHGRAHPHRPDSTSGPRADDRRAEDSSS